MKSVSTDIIGNIVEGFLKEIDSTNRGTRNAEECNQVESFKKKDHEIINLNQTTDCSGEEHFQELEDVQRRLSSILTGMNWHQQSVDSVFSNSEQSNTSSSNKSLDVTSEDIDQVPYHTVDKSIEENFRKLAKELDPRQEVQSSRLISPDKTGHEVDPFEKQKVDIPELVKQTDEKSGTCSSITSKTQEIETDAYNMLKTLNQVLYQVMNTSIAENFRKLANIKRRGFVPREKVKSSRLTLPDTTRHEMESSEKQKVDIPELAKQTDEKSGTCSSITSKTREITSKTREIETDAHKNSDAMLKTLNQVLYQVMDTSIAENFRKLANIKRREFVPTEKVESSGLTALDTTRQEMESSEKQKVDIPELVEQTDEKSGTCSLITSKTHGAKKDADHNSNATLETLHHIGSQSIPGKFKKLVNVKEIEIQSPRTLSSILTRMNWHIQFVDSVLSNSKQSNTSSSNKSFDVTLEDVNQVPYHTMDKSIEENFKKLVKELDPRQEVQSSRLISDKTRHEVDLSEQQMEDIPELVKQGDEKSGTCSSITLKTHGAKKNADQNSNSTLETLHHILHHIGSQSIPGKFKKLANVKEIEIQSPRLKSAMSFLIDNTPQRGSQILKPSSEKVEKRATESQILKSVSSDVIGDITESLRKQTEDANKNTKNADENGLLYSTKTKDHTIKLQPKRMSDKMQNIFNKRVSSSDSVIQDSVSDIIQSTSHPSNPSQKSMESASEMAQKLEDKSTDEILGHKKAYVDSLGSHSSTNLHKVINDILTAAQHKVKHSERLRPNSSEQKTSGMEYHTPGQRLTHTCDLPTEDVSSDIIKSVIFDMLQSMTYGETSGSEINSDTVKKITPNMPTDVSSMKEIFDSGSAVQCTLSVHLNRNEVREKQHSDNIIGSLSSEVIRDIIRSVMKNHKQGDTASSVENIAVSREVELTQRENSPLSCVVSTIIEDILLKQRESEAAEHASVESVCHACSKQLSDNEIPMCSDNSPVKSPLSVIERLILDTLRSVVKDNTELSQESCYEENQIILRSATSGHKEENLREESTSSDALRQIISEILARSANYETCGYANLLSEHSSNNEMEINGDMSKSRETVSFDSIPSSTISCDDMKKLISLVLSLIAHDERNASREEGNPTLFSSSSNMLNGNSNLKHPQQLIA